MQHVSLIPVLVYFSFLDACLMLLFPETVHINIEVCFPFWQLHQAASVKPEELLQVVLSRR